MKTLLMLMAGLVCIGCTSNLTKLNEEGIYARTTTASVSSIDAEGNQQSVQHGVGPTLIKQDSDGTWMNLPIPPATITVPLPGGMAYFTSPKNITIEKVTYTPEPDPGEAAMVVVGLSANISEPLAQQVAALGIALPILREMTKEEALATIEKWRVAGDMVPTIADLLLQIIATW